MPSWADIISNSDNRASYPGEGQSNDSILHGGLTKCSREGMSDCFHLTTTPDTERKPTSPRSSDHPVCRVHDGSLFRWTTFVENGPFYSVSQAAYLCYWNYLGPTQVPMGHELS